MAEQQNILYTVVVISQQNMMMHDDDDDDDDDNNNNNNNFYRPRTCKNQHYDDFTQAKHCFRLELAMTIFSNNVFVSNVSWHSSDEPRLNSVLIVALYIVLLVSQRWQH